MLLRIVRMRTQLINMRATAKQSRCRRRRSDRSLRVCPFDILYCIRRYDTMCGIVGYVGTQQAAPLLLEGLRRLEYRMQWDDAFREFVCSLDRHKPVVICGDMNVAATEMDIKNAKANEKNAGFTKEEREKFAVIKEKGFVDSFRMLYPDTVTYSWWSYRFQARQRNAGWRLDYFMVSESLKDAVADAKIHTEILGSDHCPVELDLEV